jgi:hypothetical protein
MSQTSEIKLLKRFDQNVEITGNLTVGGTLSGATDTNYYLDGITKSGNTLTFSVNGATNQTYTFGSNAFTSYTDHSTQGYLTDITTQTDPKYLRSNATDTATGTLTFDGAVTFNDGPFINGVSNAMYLDRDASERNVMIFRDQGTEQWDLWMRNNGELSWESDVNGLFTVASDFRAEGDATITGKIILGSSVNSSYLTGDSRMSVDGYIMVKGIVNTSETGTGPAAIVFGDGSTLGSDQISLVTTGAKRLYINSSGVVTIYQDLNVSGDISGANLNISNWDTAYSWGNHASAGYLTSSGGITVNGDIIAEDAEVHVGDVSGDNWTRIKHAQADGYGFDWTHNNATVIVNEQGTTNEALVLGDTNTASTDSGLFGISYSTDGGTNWTKKLDLRGNGDLYIGSSGTTRVLTTADEGSGNGLDADTLDGLNSTQFLRSDANDSTSGYLRVTGASTNTTGVVLGTYTGGTSLSASEVVLGSGGKTGWAVGDQFGAIRWYNTDGSGVGARDAVKIVAWNNQGNGTTTTTFDGNLSFYTSLHNTQSTENLRLTDNGHLVLPNGSLGVGISAGTTPSYKIDVAGNARVTNGLFLDRTTGQPNIKGTGEGHIIIDALDNSHNVYLNNYVSGNVLLANGGGSVGIGTSSPTTGKLVVHGGDIEVRDSTGNSGGRIKGYDNYHAIYFREGGQNRTNYYQYGGTLSSGLGHRFLTGGTSQSLRMQIADDGIYMANNVGIGTTSPTDKLQIDAPNSQLRLRDTDDGTFTQFSSSGNLLAIRQNSTTASHFWMNSSGNVGLGTNSPSASLDVNGVIRTRGGTYTADIDTRTDACLIIPENNYIYTADGSAYLRKLIGKVSDFIQIGEPGTSLTDGILFYSGSSCNYKWYNNSSVAMALNTTGLGIGTTSPSYRLHVDNDNANTNNAALYVRNPNSATSAIIAQFVGDSDGLQIKNIGSGDYQIRNTQQNNAIDLYDGTGGVRIRYNGSIVVEVDSSGGMDVTGAVKASGDVIAYSSDERLKENVKPIENALNKLMQIKGVTFDWKNDIDELGFEPRNRKNDVGVIAQDVEKVLPQLVAPAPFDKDLDEDGNRISKSGKDYVTVQYDRLNALLIEAVKELSNKVEELENKLNVTDV